MRDGQRHALSTAAAPYDQFRKSTLSLLPAYQVLVDALSVGATSAGDSLEAGVVGSRNHAGHAEVTLLPEQGLIISARGPNLLEAFVCSGGSFLRALNWSVSCLILQSRGERCDCCWNHGLQGSPLPSLPRRCCVNITDQ